MRILIAEDERITRVSLTRQLEGWGHSVTAAEDGEEAWARFQESPFDIVITDWEMPRLSGVDLIGRIRAIADAHFVYAIMLTSRSDKSDIVNGIEAGADDFVSKPFDREELRVRLLAGERVVRLERTLNAQNAELRAAGDRMRQDLQAAARVQRAMLPRENFDTPHVRTAWTYVPTDELAGDAIGLHLIDDRYLFAYVADVTGHGVPAALLAVRFMHAVSPSSDGASILQTATGESPDGGLRPMAMLNELNRRFCDDSNDGRFLTVILFILDTHTGKAHYGRAGHPLPVVVRGDNIVPVDETAGLPIGIVDSEEYEIVEMQLEPGDRVCLFSDGFLEQSNAAGSEQFGERRLEADLVASRASPGEESVKRAVDALTAWAGKKMFVDDVSLVVVDWRG